MFTHSDWICAGNYFIRAGTNLCAWRTRYTPSLRFIRSHPDLSALIKKYARS